MGVAVQSQVTSEDTTEGALSPRLPDNKRSRHSDAIHCHLLVYHQFLFKPLHGSPGRARLIPRPLPPSLGPRRKREALSVLIALLERRCQRSAVSFGAFIKHDCWLTAGREPGCLSRGELGSCTH